jgi:hypothetical protein
MGNGSIPAASLGPVPGSNAGLLKAAALSYTAMHYESVRRFGVSLAIIDGSIGRCYRSYARQVLARSYWCNLGKCGNAAIPGTSNHGLATTVDLMTAAQRAAVDKIGSFFGWAKACSDASWEWWHVKWNPTCTGAGFVPRPPRPDPLRKLGKRQRAAAERLLYHRAERAREARTTKGPRWHKHDRWVNYWYGRVERLWRRAETGGDRKRVLRRVLDDRNGHI